MELTWLADSPQTRCRKRALRACDRCQRSKKRCHHVDMQQNPSRVRRRQPAGDSKETRPRASSTHIPTSTIVPGRFVGEMNPEVVIRERLVVGPSSTSLRDRVGLWIPFSAMENGRALLEEAANADYIPSMHQQIPQAPDVYTAQVFEGLVRRRCESALQASKPLPAATRAPLFAIYFSQVHPVLPIIEEDLAVASPFLERAICLVAAKSRAAAPHLYLSESSALSSPRGFCTALYNGLKDAILEGLERDRLTRIRVLALIALHCEDSEGSETASMHLSQAIHQAHTIGLHLKQPGGGDQARSRLFWCLWTLDKLLASMFGRPALILDQDISIERPSTASNPVNTPKTAFEIWFFISELLSDAIRLYRPRNESPVEPGILTSFEDIVGSNIEKLDFTTLAFLELYYHAVAIVFHKTLEHATPNQQNLARNQRSLAAIRAQSIISRECTQELPPLPIISYALSLSMSVSYRQYRSSKLITHRKRAVADIEACCALLEHLSASWYSAESMARLGRKALQQIHESDPSLCEDTHGASVLQSPQLARNKRPGVIAARDAVGDHPGPMDSGYAPVAPEPVECGTQELHDWEIGNMADLDILFDDFLDLSLPTNL
ncbi:transcription factor domain-containing protein [Aspergillus saccharolyticus JOP 1030-1]|uniref:Xylanolytic transcriptional activator regulatory domain-containing protein n=1 Tax=Aspergillus saccharolyticus JOP 1030-1 TaxID=1450539 RepID=A0A319A691_9EURO|nr:hypothetical protein BP01DRAFT_302191 [Aspergillus saccharolyticus JOP 1030-1]PYH42912.1 hypothetical protein BP01DRAFT_302191 [Aspergillus saccharolyticus JOP 1030-1]